MNIMSSIEFEQQFNFKIEKAKELNKFSDGANGYFVKGLNTFVPKSNLIEELSLLKKQIGYQTIIYCNLNKNHPKYSYYYVLGFTSDDPKEIEKLIRTSKLKAFL